MDNKKYNINIESVFNDFKNMPYYRNYQAVSGSVHNISKHEDAIEAVLTSYGLTKQSFEYIVPLKKTKKQFRDELLDGENWKQVPNNVYFSQPLGTHDSPDFIFKANDVVYFIECKSGKGTTPMYNGGLPKEHYIYLFCSDKTNKTVMYLGQDVVKTQVRTIIDDHLAIIKDIESQMNEKLSALSANDNPIGISYYVRNMYQHRGSSSITNYFNKKHVFESNVMDYIRNNNEVDD